MELPLDQSEGEIPKSHSIQGIISTIIFCAYFLFVCFMTVKFGKDEYSKGYIFAKYFFLGGIVNLIGILLALTGSINRSKNMEYIRIALWCHGIMLGVILIAILYIGFTRKLFRI